jgi:hypothetical protein
MMDLIILPSSLLISGRERNHKRKVSIPRLMSHTMILKPRILKNTSIILLWTNFFDSRKVSRLPDPSESM